MVDQTNARCDQQVNVLHKTQAEIDAALRPSTSGIYDYDGDGNFDEPDAARPLPVGARGRGEETGGGAQGSDAI
jgi:hypothetical protein